MRWGIAAVACAVFLTATASPARANNQLAAVVDGRLVTLNTDGSGLRTLWAPQGGEIRDLAWSPDGSRIAFSHAGQIVVVDVAARRGVTLTRGTSPGWSRNGRRVGFARDAQTFSIPAGGGDATQLPFSVPADAPLGWAPDLESVAYVGPLGLILHGVLDPLATGVLGAPAWSPDGTRIAFARGDGVYTVPAGIGALTQLSRVAAGPPRWSPDGGRLVYAAGGALHTLPAAGGDPRRVPVAGTVTAVDWQPCSPSVSCVSIALPRCSATSVQATTQADQPVDLPALPCSDPAGRPLSLVVAKAPDNGVLDGLRYTPAPGFTGQDTVSLRVSNGAGESEAVRVTIFVVPRPAAPAPSVTPAVRRAPFLSARARPRLNSRRRTTVRLSCDQACRISVRLTARLRSGRTLRGRVVRRTIAAGRVLSVRLRLPAKPRSKPKTVWITGRVRNAAGDVRSVRLPVTIRR